MNRYRIIVVICFVFILLTFLFNFFVKKKYDINGKIIFSNGNGIYIFDENLTLEKVIYSGAGDYHLSELEGRIVVSIDGMLTQFDTDNGEKKNLGVGLFPAFNHKNKSLFYYRKEQGVFGLYVKYMGEEVFVHESPQTIFIKHDVGNKQFEYFERPLTRPVVDIGGDYVVFVGRNKNLWIYDVVRNVQEDIGVTNCIPVLYRKKKNQILCKDFENDKIYLLSLENKKVNDAGINEVATAYFYSKHEDVLFFSTVKYAFPFSERYPLVSYSFETGEKKEILYDYAISSAVLVEDQ